jgi:uncharacterized protein
MDSHGLLRQTFGAPRVLVGMVHVPGLPGTPRAAPSLEESVELVVREARAWAEAGAHAVALENMHDRPYLRGAVGPEIVAAMTVLVREVVKALRVPVGLQLLAAANREALAVAQAAGATFVRVEGFVFAHVADEGLIQGCAGDLLRYRRAIGADHVRVFADVKKKHAAHAITADVGIAETAHAAEFFLADGVIVTGAATGLAASAEEVAAVAGAVGIPVLVGSGTTPDNVGGFRGADGFIVGSAAKVDGHWSNPLDPDRVRRLVDAFGASAPR